MADIQNAKKLIRLVSDHLDSFEMADWIRLTNPDAAPDKFILTVENLEEGEQKCGTTLCLAGFAGLAMGEKVQVIEDEDGWKSLRRIEDDEDEYRSWSELGQEFLDISDALRVELFYTNNALALAMLIDLARGVSDGIVLRSFQDNYYDVFSGMGLREMLDTSRYIWR